MALAAATAYDIRKAVQALQATRLGQLQVSQTAQVHIAPEDEVVADDADHEDRDGPDRRDGEGEAPPPPFFDGAHDSHDCLPPPE